MWFSWVREQEVIPSSPCFSSHPLFLVFAPQGWASYCEANFYRWTKKKLDRLSDSLFSRLYKFYCFGPTRWFSACNHCLTFHSHLQLVSSHIMRYTRTHINENHRKNIYNSSPPQWWLRGIKSHESFAHAGRGIKGCNHFKRRYKPDNIDSDVSHNFGSERHGCLEVFTSMYFWHIYVLLCL